jgi:hypothetical protein
MTLQSKSKITCITRLVLASMLLAAAWVSAPAQTNTFPASGNVGVGTTAPTLQSGTTNTMIEVKGTVNPGVGLTSTAAGGREYFVYSSQTNPGYFSVFDATAGADRFVISSSGYVGLGTSVPSDILHVGGGFLSTIRNEMSTWLSQNVPGGETDWSNNAYYSSGWKYRLGDEASQIQQLNGDIRFFTAPAGTAGNGVTFSEKLTVLQGGNVGIGTATPKTKLDLKQSEDTFVGGLHLRRATTNDTWALAHGTDNSLYMGYANNASGADAGNDFTVYPLVLTNGGNVGVGTAAPGHKLDVQGGSINSSAGLCIAGDCKTAWSQVGGGGGSSQWTGTSSIYYNGGNVGIGTTSPSDPLHIDSAAGWGLRLRYPGNGVYLRMSANQVSAYNSAGVGSDLFLNVDGGKVGIGTTTPASNLQIGSQAPGATGTPVTMSLGGSYSSSAGSNLKLKLYDDGVASNTYGIGVSSGSMDFGVHSSATYKWYAGGVSKMTLTSNGDLSVTGTIAAKYQDVAEWVPSSQQLAAGTVVVLDTTKSNQVVSSTTGYDTRVAGVISAQPGITLGESGEGKVLVATTGRVRLKVDASRGPIQIGDLLVTSDVPGVAMKSEAVNLGGVQFHRPGTIIGKALEPLAKGQGEILVLLSLQ